MASTIGTTINVGITLGTGTYTSPLTVTSSGAVEATKGDAIYGDNSAAWTIVNAGTVETTGSGGNGVKLLGDGSVANTGTGLIEGTSGVFIKGSAGTVSNAATIIGTAGYGVYLGPGGSVANTGTGLIKGSFGGVFVGTAGTVSNSATMIGTSSYGVRSPSAAASPTRVRG